MANTPPGALPVISEAMTIKFRLGALLALGSFLIGSTIFATVFYVTATEWMKSIDRRLERVEYAVGVDHQEPAAAKSAISGTKRGANP